MEQGFYSYKMAVNLTFTKETDQVLFAGNSYVKEVILNRPRKMNSLNYEMIRQMTRNLISYENDSSVKLVILKANGKAFCVGGDVKSVVASALLGHWTYPISFYKKQLTLDHLIATYKKPVVSLINGAVMGGGAGLCMNTTFRIVTEKTVFAMPEASIGLYPDVGASYFLSRLPGYFGEYVGLTGAQLNGAEMIACGLATHFVPSKRLHSLENALQAVITSDISTIASVIHQFTENAYVNQDSPFRSLETINTYFSKGTVEEIIMSLESGKEKGAKKWITDALNYMHSSSPTSLKMFLRSVREGREQNIEQCLSRECDLTTHLLSFESDFFEGARAKLFDKDNKPLWKPSKLELVSKEMVDQFFKKIDDEDCKSLELPNRSKIHSKL